MPESWNATDSYRTVQVFSGFAIDVEVVGFVTQPSQVYGRVAVPLTDWQADQAIAIIDPIAAGIESRMSDTRIAGMRYEEDVDASGQLVANMVITVQAPNAQPGQPGPFYGEVSAPTYAFGAGQGASYLIDVPIAAEYARLQALTGA